MSRSRRAFGYFKTRSRTGWQRHSRGHPHARGMAVFGRFHEVHALRFTRVMEKGVDDLREYVEISVRYCLRYPATPRDHAAVPAGPVTMGAALYIAVIAVACECATARRAELIQVEQARRARARSVAAVVRRRSPRLLAHGGARSSEALEGVSLPGVSRPPAFQYGEFQEDPDGTTRRIALVELQTGTPVSEPAGPGEAGGADL